MVKKKKNDFIAQGTILAMASILVRIIGMVYRIPLTAIIGDEGNGLYSYAYSVYTILLLFSSYSLPLAVSKMVSAKVQVGEWKNVERIFYCALLFGMGIGTVFAVLVLVGARWFTITFYHAELAAIALRFMAPTILVMALLGVFRGFFQGLQTAKPTAASQLLEQLVHAVVAVISAWFLFGYGSRMNEKLTTEGLDAAWGAAGGALGTALGAIAALVFLIFLFWRWRPYLNKKIKGDISGREDNYKVIFKVLFSIAIPVIISTAVYNLIDLIDGSIFSYYMETTGKEGATRIWGAYNGKCLLLVHIPVSISSAMAVSLIPSLTAAFTAEKRRDCLKMIHVILKFTTTVAFPSAVGLCLLAEPIIKTLFPSDQSSASSYLMLGAAAVIFFSLSTITNSILQGIDRIKVPVTHSAISLAIHAVIAAILMWGFDLGIYGIIVSYMIFGLSMCLLNFMSLDKYLGYTPNIRQIFVGPFVCSAIMGAACRFVYWLISPLLGRAISMLLAVATALIVYFVLIIKTCLMTEHDLDDLPMGHRLIRLARKMKLL